MITREDLYRLVWSKPMNKISEELSVSSLYLGRLCEMLDVPRPALGYWNKLAVGKAPAPKPLAEAGPNTKLAWDLSKLLPSRKPVRVTPRKSTERAPRSPLPSVHRLVKGAREAFVGGRPVEDTEYLKPFKRLLVDVTASKAAIDRVLDFADALFLAFEVKGYPVSISEAGEGFHGVAVDGREDRSRECPRHLAYGRWSPMRPTIVRMRGVVFGLAIVEMSQQVIVRYTGGGYVRESEVSAALLRRLEARHSWTMTREWPCQKIRLVAYSPSGLLSWQRDWQESGSKTLDEQIPAIIRALEKEIPNLKAKLAEAQRLAEIDRKKREEEWERYKRREDKRRVEESIKASREHLTAVIQQWADAMSVERFFEMAQSRAAALDEEERAGIEERLRVAKELMGSRDPLDCLRAWKSPRERYEPKYPEGGEGDVVP